MSVQLVGSKDGCARETGSWNKNEHHSRFTSLGQTDEDPDNLSFQLKPTYSSSCWVLSIGGVQELPMLWSFKTIPKTYTVLGDISNFRGMTILAVNLVNHTRFKSYWMNGIFSRSFYSGWQTRKLNH